MDLPFQQIPQAPVPSNPSNPKTKGIQQQATSIAENLPTDSKVRVTEEMLLAQEPLQES